MKKKFLICLIMMLFNHLYAQEFSANELKILNSGSILKKIKWHKNLIWPEVTIYKIIGNTPKSNIMEFLKFENHKNFIPDMVESRVIKKISDIENQTFYEMSMPWPVKRSTHVTQNTLVEVDGHSFTLKWKLIKADFLKSTDGYINFSSFNDKTLLTYASLMIPNTPMASLFKNRVADDVEKSVIAIANHLDKTIK